MRTKKPLPEPQEPRKRAEELPIEASTEPMDDISRLSVPVDSQGNVLWDRMRNKTKEQFRDILKKPETVKVLGLSPDQTAQVVEVFDPAWTGSLYDSLGKIEAMIGAGVFKITPEQAERVFTYSSLEKEKLASPTAKVINKYASVWMVRFKEEIALAFLLVTITMMKIQIAKSLSAITNRTQEANQPSNSAIPPSSKSAQQEISELERMTREAPPEA